MARFGGSTVYDRFKKTGYITGPKHSMLGQMADAPVPRDAGGDPGGQPGSPDDEAAEGESQTPPNLRDSDSTLASCGDCAHYGASGTCELYSNYGVTPNEVCDSVEKGGSNGEESTGTEEVTDEARP